MTNLRVAAINCGATQLVRHKNTQGTWVGSGKEHFFHHSRLLSPLEEVGPNYILPVNVKN